jgi:AcrR family transcriptional regulator
MARPAKFTDEGILDAAGKIIGTSGPAAATMAAIAASIEAPNASIYHRFQSRDELLGRVWLRKAAFFQDNFVKALEVADATEAGLRAALSLPASTRADLNGARILVLHRREDFLGEGWPSQMRQEAKRLGLQVTQTLDELTRRIAGTASKVALRAVTFAVLDVPYAAVRRYVAGNRLPPKQVDELIASTYRAVIRNRESFKSR